MTGKVIFRVDGNTRIGLGHLVRCIALAQMLKNEFDIIFFCKDIPDQLVKELTANEFEFSKLDEEGKFFEQISNNDIVVLDGYDFDVEYQKKVRSQGCKLVCIDDVHEHEFVADVIINHAPGISASNYRARSYTQFALGPDYALLRPVFLNGKMDHRSTHKIEAVFVCFGGSDSKNITQLVTDVLKSYKIFKKVVLVTGVAYSFSEKLAKTIADDTRFCIYHAVDPETMFNLMSETDLAIVPCSGILQEVLAVGSNVISGIYVENQKYFFEKYKALNAFESAEKFAKEDLITAIDRSLNNDDVHVNRSIDGRSGKRLLNIFTQLATEASVELRKVNENDLSVTFDWANNSEIRKFFFNKKPIKYSEHKKWFNSKLNDGNCFYYIGEQDGRAFGAIRFDVKDNKAQISYLVDTAYQNKGLGTILLKKGLEFFIDRSDKNVSIIYGEVFYENVASVKVFKKLGYDIQIDTSSNIINFEKKVA